MSLYVLFSNFCTCSSHQTLTYRIHIKHLLSLTNSKIKNGGFDVCLRIRMPRVSEEQRNRGLGMLMAGVAVSDVLQAFDCTRDKLMTRYVHTGTVRERQWPGRPHATTARTAAFYYGIYVNTFYRRRSLPDVLDYLPIRSVTVCGKITIPSMRVARQ